jgi:hypothetical protein
VLGLKNKQLYKVFRNQITFCVHREVLDAAAVRVLKQGDVLVPPTLSKRVEGQ